MQADEPLIAADTICTTVILVLKQNFKPNESQCVFIHADSDGKETGNCYEEAGTIYFDNELSKKRPLQHQIQR